MNYLISQLFFPSLFLWISSTGGALFRPVAVHELFGNERYYLDVQLTIPRRFFSEGDFIAYFSGEKREVRARGKLRKQDNQWTYDFSSDDGIFVGILENVPGRCEPKMKYEWNQQGIIERGSLNAGFCS